MMLATSRLSSLAWLLGSIALLPPCSCNNLNAIEIRGYKFFDSATGEEFVVRGIAYEPRPNDGPLNQNSIDYFTEEYRPIWERDIPFLQALGVNAVRLYAVDASLNHDAFMCAMSAAGIYVLVSLARDCPICAVTRDRAPDCYPSQLKRQGEAVVNAFANYPNLLGFSAGNEVNHYTPQNNPEWNAPCQKKFLRDMRKYIASCPNMRKVPVGLISADSERDQVSLYYNCGADDPYEHAEWFGLNVYLACGANITNYQDEKGFTGLVESYKSYNYSIPVMLTEFGCLSKSFPTIRGYEGQRSFDQARWLLESEDLRDQFAGGFVFEYSIEKQNAMAESPYPFTKMAGQNYGVGYLSPENCNDVDVPCKYNPEPCFDNLQEAYHNSSVSATNLHNFTIPNHRSGRTQCPTNFTALTAFRWRPDRVRDLKCPTAGPASHFVCPANLDELRTVPPTQQTSGRWLERFQLLLEAVLFLTVVTIIYAFLVSTVHSMRKNREKKFEKNFAEPTRMTVVVPCCATRESDSESDESAGLLSMKRWNYYNSGVQ